MSKFALVGLGFISQRHIDAIHEVGGELTCACDIDPNREQKVAGTPFFTSFQSMMDSVEFENVDFVSIATPNYLHYPMIVECLNAGKKVICEKPLTLNSEDALRFEKDVFPVLQLRYHPEVQEFVVPTTSKDATLVARVMREPWFWNCWKGNPLTAGCPAYHIIGVHYLDFLIDKFGGSYEVVMSWNTNKEARGVIQFPTTRVMYDFRIMPTTEGQDRYFEMDGQKLRFSNKDNLSLEDLHYYVYHDALRGEGISPKEAAQSLKLIETLLHYA